MKKIIILLCLLSSFLFSLTLYEEFTANKRVVNEKFFISSLVKERDRYLESLKKDMFETTVQYNERVEKETQKVYQETLEVMNYKLNLEGAGNAFLVDYDADGRVAKFDLEWHSFDDAFFKTLFTNAKAFLTIGAESAKEIFQKVKVHRLYAQLDYGNEGLVLGDIYILHNDTKYFLFLKKGVEAIAIKEKKIPLTIKIVPHNAIITIVNIKPKYMAGMALEAGNYHLKISKEGYKTIDKWIKLDNSDAFAFTLQKKRQKPRRKIAYNTFKDRFTGLKWHKVHKKMTALQANRYCKSIGGRLPMMSELRNLSAHARRVSSRLTGWYWSRNKHRDGTVGGVNFRSRLQGLSRASSYHDTLCIYR